VTQYGYDNENNLTSITDAKGRVTSFEYDSFRRVTRTTFPSSLVEAYGYDAVGNLTSKTDRKGQTIQYVYDALDRLEHKGYPDSTGVDYVYDLAGKVMQVNDPSGQYGFAYDNMGRLIGTTTQYSFLPGVTNTTSYTYDKASNRKTITAPDGSTNTYGYDSLNRLSSLTNSLTGQFGFGYDALSRRTQLTRPNGINTTYAYDSLSHLLSVLHQSGATIIDGAGYGYDLAGNRTSKTNYLNGITEEYTYDPLYQLTQVVQGTTTTESYTYDEVGNRLSSLGMPTYDYNSSNQLTTTSNASYTYDYSGNTLTKTDTTGSTQYAWDFENRLTSVTLPDTGNGPTVVTFKYDPFGRRVQKSGPMGTTNYLYDGPNLLEEADSSGSVLARYTQGPGVDHPLAEFRSGVTSFYEPDGVGSATSLTSSTGTITQTYNYDTFGNLSGSTGTVVNPLRYTAREFDSETGLYYDRARYYDSQTGRFISEDPIGFNGGMDVYAYAGNSPATLTDPFGLQGPTTATPPVTTPYPGEPPAGAVDEVIEALESAGQSASGAASTAASAALAILYLLNPSGGNNAQWANSREAQFEKQCKNGPDCSKASAWQLAQARITDPHQFKEDILGKGAKKSSWDICACKDGSIILKAVGQCGKPGSGIETDVTWK